MFSAIQVLFRPACGIALLAAGNVCTLYGAWLLSGLFGNVYVPFLLLVLPWFAGYAIAEKRGFQMTRLVALQVAPGDSPWISAAGFAVFGVGWFFLMGSELNATAEAPNGSTSAQRTVLIDGAIFLAVLVGFVLLNVVFGAVYTGGAGLIIILIRQVLKRQTFGTQPAQPVAGPKADTPPGPGPGREAMETVVFVVVLVLMLKLFVVEAFVIPTGSMAESLFGYKKVITCPECGYEFPVNASREAEPTGGEESVPTNGYCCPNCRYETTTKAKEVKWSSGDRVLVGKFLGVDDRGHVVVFKYPEEPQTRQTAQNYIKRLVGLPGETVAVYNGDLYVTKALTYPADAADDAGQPLYPRPEKATDLWRARNSGRWVGDDYGYANARAATDLFDASRKEEFKLGGKGFEIVRKPDELVLATRRIVYDNDHQSVNLAKTAAPPRWQPLPNADAGWKANGPTGFAHTGADLGWMRYQHLVPTNSYGWQGTAGDARLAAQPITNFMGFNAGIEGSATRPGNLADSDNWVGDLLLECTATVADGGAVVLELSKGETRYRAEFDKGQVRLKMFSDQEEYTREDGNKSVRTRTVPVGDDSFTLVSKPSGVKADTAHRLRFANVDCRLRVWVDDQPIHFDGKADYAPPVETAKDAAKDSHSTGDVDRPACVGAVGVASVASLKVWRDTYYTHTRGVSSGYTRNTGGRGDLSTYYVQPGHYLCMGDNSSQSSDGRMWGLVPERLMLGRAVFIFFPFDRLGFIR